MVRSAPLVLLLAITALSAAAAETEAQRRKLGERYARAFSDPARSVHVAWNDAACAFVETTIETGWLQVSTTRVTHIPASRTEATPTDRGVRAGHIDVVFRCGAGAEHCIVRTHQQGTIVIGTDRLTEHTMKMSGASVDLAKLKVELDELRLHCIRPVDDGGAPSTDGGA